MKHSTTYHLKPILLAFFCLVHVLIMAQSKPTGVLNNTNGHKGFYPPTVKQTVVPTVTIVPEPVDLSVVYLGAVSNVPASQNTNTSGETTGGGDAPSLAGETIANAINIASVPFTTTGNTCSYANDYDEACPYTGGHAPDVVFKYLATSNITINVGLCNSGYDTKLYVYDNAYTPGSPMACNDDYCGYASRISNLSLSAGHWYYFIVDGYIADCGNYQLDIVPTPTCTPTCPAGSIVETELQIHNGGTDNTNGGCNSSPAVFVPITLGQNVCGQVNTYKTGILDNRDTDWYRLDLSGTGDSTQVTWDVLADFNPQICIVKAGNPVCVGNTTIGSLSGIACTHTTLTKRVAPGVYYFWVAPSDFTSYPPGVATYSYIGSVTGGSVPWNDYCGMGITINEVNSLPFNTTYASHDGPALPCTGAYEDRNLWYNYFATFTGPAIFKLCGSSYDTKLAVFAHPNCLPTNPVIGCNDDACGFQSQLVLDVVAGQGYEVLVGGFSSTSFGQGYLTIEPYCLPDCPPGSTPENEPIIQNDGSDVTNGGCNFTPANFTPISLGQTYCGMINTYLNQSIETRDIDWYKLDLTSTTDSTLLTLDVYAGFNAEFYIMDAMNDDCTQFNYLSWGDGPSCAHHVITARVKPGKYYILISCNGFSGLPPEAGPFRYYAKLTGLPIPSNDHCMTPSPIGEVSNLAFNTTAASHDGTGTCLASSQSRNLWYSYSPACTGNATASTCGSYFDTKLAVYDGTMCSPVGTLMGCNDDFCGTSASVTFQAIYGHNYKIEVGGFSLGSYGYGLLTVGCEQSLPPNLNLQGILLFPGQAPCYDALNTIVVGGNATSFAVFSGGSATLIAGQKIQFLPGSSVQSGGYLHGMISPAGPWCAAPAIPSQTATEPADLKEATNGPKSTSTFFKVYPNPTSGLFTLELSGEEQQADADVEIYSMYGDRILTKHLSGQLRQTLSLESEAHGIYILRVVRANETGSVKIIRN